MLKLSQLVDGFDLKEKPSLEVCEICIESKQTKLPHKTERIRASRPLELIHSDICGPINPESYDEMKYFITFVDDYSHFVQIRLMKNKSDAFECFQNYVAEAESQFNLKISRLRCDNGGEYKSNHFTHFCMEKGIKLEFTMPYTPEQNGVSERFNRTIVEKARAMLLEAKCGKELWGEACMAACYVINRIPTSATEKVPAEIWFNHRQNISKLRVFGCVAYLHTPKQFCSKFGSKTRKYIFVGYCANGYRLYDPENQMITTGRDITFNEESIVMETSIDNNTEDVIETIIEDQPSDDSTIIEDSVNDVIGSDNHEREVPARPKRNVNLHTCMV
uniref:Copia protein n=1 Tax=Cacopsylla melanoneura TaxID=428564 RepID=A0A8D8QIU2_9HEMI